MFNATEPQFRSSEAVIGTVQDVELFKVDEEAGLTKLKISVKGEASGTNFTVWFAYNPAFFAPDFQPNRLVGDGSEANPGFDGGEKLLFAYENNIATGKKNQTPHLLGLVNRDYKKYTQVGEALQELGTSATPDEVITVLKDYLIDRAFGQGFGAFLKQQVKRTEGANGEIKWAKTPYMQLDNKVANDSSKPKQGYWTNNAENRKKQCDRAAKSKVNEYDPNRAPWFVVTFDQDGGPLEDSIPF